MYPLTGPGQFDILPITRAILQGWARFHATAGFHDASRRRWAGRLQDKRGTEVAHVAQDFHW